MSRMPEPRELGLAAAGLIRASLTRDKVRHRQDSYASFRGGH